MYNAEVKIAFEETSSSSRLSRFCHSSKSPMRLKSLSATNGWPSRLPKLG